MPYARNVMEILTTRRDRHGVSVAGEVRRVREVRNNHQATTHKQLPSCLFEQCPACNTHQLQLTK
jgi:hypothetical protein